MIFVQFEWSGESDRGVYHERESVGSFVRHGGRETDGGGGESEKERGGYELLGSGHGSFIRMIFTGGGR